MARYKTQQENKEPEQKALVDNAVASMSEEELEVIEATRKTRKPEKPVAAKTAAPPFVDSLLRLFYQYPELYVDAQGGVYVPETQPAGNKEAILYKNPYYQI